MSLLLEGTLEDIRLADLLRLIARERRTGWLRVTVDGISARLSLRDGYVTGVLVDEEDESADLEAIVLRLVRHRRGSFQLLPAGDDEVPQQSDGSIHAEALAGKSDMALLELEERLDAAGSEAGTPARDAFPTPKQMEALDPEVRSVFGLVDGERNLSEVVLRSRLDPATVLDALETLADESLVKLARPPAPAAAAAPGAAAGRARFRLLDAVAAVVPVALLLAGLGFVSTHGAQPERPEPFEIRADPLAAAQAAYRVERLRAALEAHRFVEGRWPERLGALAERGYVPEAALTDARGRPYYYAVREDGFVLLAPER